MSSDAEDTADDMKPTDHAHFPKARPASMLTLQDVIFSSSLSCVLLDAAPIRHSSMQKQNISLAAV